MQFDFKRMLKYEYNVGDQDQKIRYAVGGLSIFISLFLGSVPLLLLGIALLISGYTHFCPIYAGLGKTTACPRCGQAEKACGAAKPGEKAEAHSCGSHKMHS